MKKNLFVTTICLLTLIIGHTQTNVYHPFPNENVVWSGQSKEYGFNCSGYCPNGHCAISSNYQDSLAGDTIIGSYTYHKILREWISNIHWVGQTQPSCGPDIWHFAKYSYYHAIREDVLQRKIFIHDYPNEKVLYDFSKSVGDTITYYLYGPVATISKIDSIAINGKYRKRFWLWGIYDPAPSILDSGYVALIEGIGSTFGLFEPLGKPFENHYRLNCVRENFNTIYPNNSIPCSSLAVNIKEEKNNFSFSIYPNPFSTQTTLHTGNLFKNITLAVYNSFGQQMKQINNLSGQEVIFRRDNLPSGLYFIRLMQDNEVIATDKLVITDN